MGGRGGEKVIFLDDEETKGFQTGTGEPSAVLVR